MADFTYIWSAEGWLYVAVVLDLFFRRVVGWSTQNNMTSQLVADALMMAVWRRGVGQLGDGKLLQLNEDRADRAQGDRTRGDIKADVFSYIERFYNPTRRHSTLGYVSQPRSRKLKKLRSVSAESAVAQLTRVPASRFNNGKVRAKGPPVFRDIPSARTNFKSDTGEQAAIRRIFEAWLAGTGAEPHEVNRDDGEQALSSSPGHRVFWKKDGEWAPNSRASNWGFLPHQGQGQVAGVE